MNGRFIKYGIVALVLVILLAIIYFQFQTNSKLSDRVETEVKFRNALIDTVTRYQNKEKEWVAEKLTIQKNIKDLDKLNSQLTSSQKELVARIKEVEKTNNIIAAALINTNVMIDSLIHKGKTVVDTLNKSIEFSNKYVDGKKSVDYKFVVGNVMPINSKINPTLRIDSLYFSNKQFIDFHWNDDKKNGYPVTFSVTNSNDFFKTGNIESYVIPSISKEHLNPTGWQKVENFFIRNGKSFIKFGFGAAVGAGGMLILLK